jgi:FMN-dependent NADH-azoreductase
MIKDEEKGIELKVNEAVQNKLSLIKTEIANAAKKLQPAQHLRFTLNTIDSYLNELKDEAKQLI